MTVRATSFTQLSKSYWANQIENLSEINPVSLPTSVRALFSALANSTEVSLSQFVYELISAPRWTRKSIERSREVVEALLTAALSDGLKLDAPVEVDGAIAPFVSRLVIDAEQLDLGFGMPAKHALEFLALSPR